MALYMIGDVQGCDEALGRLLETVDFSPSRDTLYLLGDLVNRGPQSLDVLHRLMALESSVHCLLGNHDLHLLAVAHGVRKPHRSDTVADILAAPDRRVLLDWLRHRPMALYAHGWLMVHAGVLPQWDRNQTLALAGELESVLRSPDWTEFLHGMYGNQPDLWSDSLRGDERLRVIVNTLTRLRFCSAQGVMEFDAKDGADNAPHGFMPWFDVPGRRTAGVPVAFGHWSTVGAVQREDVLPLDTGCVWGGCLTAARMGDAPGSFELLSVRCAQARQPCKD
ncbi:MAG: symmetrical bis(5'-nucleosyl)-tetraphosphatase [Hydrogenophaga sp.]|uniref:symmetrical bis(5'-nucleosyl)-tetraphosphatase n=1 Tax=Hydrogenophaga sp. TaxID=1904254 RepID=UPI001BC56943|nr:symmetrical bis(5'-nucleosyl)-tetraphosphatase [Hydrogenophaga sp.]MBS3910643.1 symmetrical bis(5'-nucleosyl)-tetraphosphatase [Hydrogenophaga sp.]MDO9148588.1 symmetrical bis(5'-nucleosyl)-tetraphosphatase [Hydrogenophaga sp.]MDO9605455.1 symmetrical bis(5'-nucleosyl)-tetraphosphatase [Hydrogenophaga sp.]MDP2165197.1 symmetrical bis(5'-nucleosyl)-tetraphosphatase [Hydrogenophaga sp.]